MARYRDRKLNRTFTFVGSDVYSDGTARGQSKPIYEPGSNIINNYIIWVSVNLILVIYKHKIPLKVRNNG